MDKWGRKHCDAMATACQALLDGTALPADSREALKSIRVVARSLAKGHDAGAQERRPAETVETLVGKLCGVCRDIGDRGCPGRRDWLEQCQLVAQPYATAAY